MPVLPNEVVCSRSVDAFMPAVPNEVVCSRSVDAFMPALPNEVVCSRSVDAFKKCLHVHCEENRQMAELTGHNHRYRA